LTVGLELRAAIQPNTCRLDKCCVVRERLPVQRELHLDGGEITIIKAIGFSGSLHGKLLLERISDMEFAELADSLSGLMTLGYILSTKVNVNTKEDMERTSFRVNPSYARDLREALQPAGRRRGQERQRRQRN
jgi:hypothetical protein